MIFVDDTKTAVFGSERTYRYKLTRKWDVNKPTIAWICLNPSTADETTNDPTVRRCINYSKDWGYGKMVLGNIFAYRSTDPDALFEQSDPVGPLNDGYLQEIANSGEKVVVAWGNHGPEQGRGEAVLSLVDTDLYCLDTTQKNQPIHPLYQPKDAQLEEFNND